MMKTLILPLLLLSGACLADASVSVYYHGRLMQTLKLGEGARLDELLRDPQLPSAIYWRRAQITTPDHQQQFARQQAAVIQQLTQLEGVWRADQQDALADSAARLAQQLAGLHVTGRLPLEVDPDTALRSQQDNPRLAGHYQLYLAARQPEVAMFGLMAALPSLPLVAGAGVDQYWQPAALLAGADPAHLYVIQPTGAIERVPVAIWNKLHREPMAGAALLVGFDPDRLPSSFIGINQRIAEILANRVPH